MAPLQPDQQRWMAAVEQGRFGVWDLNPALDLVHYSPRWKEHMGFADPELADSTSFWRCRVHPDDLAPMLRAMRSHLDGFRTSYEARFRVRSNGSGYRLMLSRGLVVERDAQGDARRMVGTMVDLTDRPALPLREQLAATEAGSMMFNGPCLPFHLMLMQAGPTATQGLLDQVGDLLDLSLRDVSPKG